MNNSWPPYPYSEEGENALTSSSPLLESAHLWKDLVHNKDKGFYLIDPIRYAIACSAIAKHYKTVFFNASSKEFAGLYNKSGNIWLNSFLRPLFEDPNKD